jgi:NodT family efflux transporter outer membrane factor (OMF) lipoprotein
MSRLILTFSVFVGSLMGAGCQTTSLEQFSADQASVEAKIPANWQSIISQGASPQSWDTLFDDPLLADYMRRSERLNPDIKRAVIRVRQSEASLREARTVLLPILTTDFQVSGHTGLDDINITESFGNGLTASYDVDLFGRNRISVSAAENLLDAQESNRERVRRVVMAQVARTYIQIIETDYQLRLAKDNLSFIEETLRISEARFNEGDIARDQFALAQLETANAAANVESLELSARNLRRSLAVLSGDNPDFQLKVATQLPNAADLNLSLMPAEVLGHRFDVAASRARIAIGFAGLQQAERLNWPTLGLSGRLSGGGFAIEDLFHVDDYLASLGASAAATLFDGGRKDARLDNAQASVDEALLNYDEILRNAMLDVENGFDRITAARRSLAALERGSEAADRALEIEKIKYAEGESIILDVLTVQRRVNAILASYISTKRRLLDAQIDTYLALGGSPAQ